MADQSAGGSCARAYSLRTGKREVGDKSPRKRTGRPNTGWLLACLQLEKLCGLVLALRLPHGEAKSQSGDCVRQRPTC